MTGSKGSSPGWSGDMLDRPELVAAFAEQLRQVLGSQAEFVARIRRDAEAMWRANPPQGYSSFESWWRHRWVVGPFGAIQEHIEKAAELTHQMEARYRRGRHEIPAAKQAAAIEKQRAKERKAAALPPAPAPAPPSPPSRSAGTGRTGGAEAGSTAGGRDFLALIRDETA